MLRPATRRQCLILASFGVVPIWQGLAQQSPPTFRSGVDLVAIDVQVVDRDGGPVFGLRPDQFEVTIDGKRRKVVSADFVRTTQPGAERVAGSASDTQGGSRPAMATEATPGQVYILAFDTMSFSALEVAPARDAAHAFVDRLSSTDLVGLIDFPSGSTVDVTADRARLLAAVDAVVGRAGPPSVNRFGLTPSEISDLTHLSSRNDVSLLESKVHEICGMSGDVETCEQRTADTLGGTFRVVKEAEALAQFEEAEIAQRTGALQALLRALARSHARRTVVLISAGFMVSDRPGGRPDVQGVGRLVGQAAAGSNTTIHALYFDRIRTNRVSASRAGARLSDMQRDSEILSRPLDAIAGASGGRFFGVAQGGGEPAFDRILKETSAYYLLGVEPQTTDRDGRPRELRVKVAGKGLTVRARSWVTVSKPAAATAGAGPATPALAPPPPLPLPALVKPLADAYAQRDSASFERLLSAIGNPANLLHDFRTAESAWSGSRRRAAALALELALSGLSNRNGFAFDEGVKLLALAHVTVEQSADAAFACAWLHAEAAMLEGLWRPPLALAFVTRAVAKCPTEPRLQLARAVLLEQQSAQPGDPTQAQDVIAAYDAVPKASDAAIEAEIRASWLAHRSNLPGGSDRTLQPLSAAIRTSADTYVRYFGYLIEGHVLRARGEHDAAEAAYRQALLVAPGAQSGRVALMTLLLGRGNGDEAASLSEAVQTTGRQDSDPWWMYSRGDFRVLPSTLARLREMAR
jgi:VWFA-related protein